LRDVAAIGAGAVAGAAGAVYGLGEGLIRGGIEAYPRHLTKGAGIGRTVTAPVGKIVGGAGAAAVVGVGAVAAPALTVLAAAGGAVNGALTGAYLHGETEMPKAINAGAQWGASAFGTALKAAGGAIGGAVAGLVVLPTILYPPLGKELIPAAFNKGREWGGVAGEATGTFVGSGVGGLGGAFVGAAVSAYKGLPMGYEMGKEAGKETAKLITELPAFAKEAWSIGYVGGGELAGDVGGVLGGTVGFATATGATVLAGLDNSIDRASGWAGATAQFVRGKDKAEQPPEQPAKPAEGSNTQA
jgi:hypothetical protein